MAGKTQQPRSASLIEQRAERSRTKLNARLGRETDPRRRVSIAMDYLRSALAVNPDAQAAETAVIDLIKTADRLYTPKEDAK